MSKRVVWEKLTTATQWERELKNLLNRSKFARYKAVAILYQAQTENERVSRDAQKVNGVGFNRPDSPILTPIAEKVIKEQNLTEDEELELLIRIKKYWRQLMNASKTRQRKDNKTEIEKVIEREEARVQKLLKTIGEEQETRVDTFTLEGQTGSIHFVRSDDNHTYLELECNKKESMIGTVEFLEGSELERVREILERR